MKVNKKYILLMILAIFTFNIINVNAYEIDDFVVTDYGTDSTYTYNSSDNVITSNTNDTNDYKYTDALGFTGIVELNDYLYVSTGKRITDSDTDGMIVKYDLDLTYIDEESYNNGSVERFNKIISDSKDHIIMIGNGYIRDEDDSVNSDGIIAKYNTELNKIAVVSYGDDKDDYFNDLVLDGEDYLVAGYSSFENGSYYSKFIKYSDALKVLVTE